MSAVGYVERGIASHHCKMTIPKGEADDPLTRAVIGAAMRTRARLGVGLLESVYQGYMERELTKASLRFRAQAAVPISIDDWSVDAAFRADLIIENRLIVELKAVQAILPVHKAQVLTYLRLAEIPVGLLLNFHAMPFTAGIHRFVMESPPRR